MNSSPITLPYRRYALALLLTVNLLNYILSSANFTQILCNVESLRGSAIAVNVNITNAPLSCGL